jgi:2-methylisocitrate lyase-like PEP mutase family enzyme
LIPPRNHAAKVGAIKQRSPELFINARVDTFWLGQDATVSATLDRAAVHAAAQAAVAVRDGLEFPSAATFRVVA